MESERITRERLLEQLEASIKDVIASRSTAEDRFQAWAMDEIATLKAAMDEEREARIAEDEDIVNALNDYTRALQEGLKLVNLG